MPTVGFSDAPPKMSTTPLAPPLGRPRLRPSLSRRTKYVDIAPNAERKLGREARRKEHDLRKLVGHANFLDTLMDELGLNDEEEQQPETPPAVEATTPAPEVVVTEPEEEEEVVTTPDLEEAEEVYSTDSDSYSDSDEENDEEHALARTPSHVKVRIASDAMQTPLLSHGGYGGVSIVNVNDFEHGLTIAEAIQKRNKDNVQVSLVEVIDDVEHDRSARLTPLLTAGGELQTDYFGTAVAVNA